MKDDLIKLINYAEIDKEIDLIKAELAEMPERLAGLENTWGLAKRAFDEQNKILTEKTTLLSQYEKDIASNLEKIKDKETRLHQLKTQKEFQAVNKEIGEMKRANTDMDGRIKSFSEDIIPLSPKVEELKLKLDAAQSAYQNERDSVQQSQQELSNKMTEIVDKRNTIVIPAAIFAKYDRIHRSVQPAVAKIVNNSCGECNMRISPQVVIQVGRMSEMHHCANCSRIIYL